LCRKRQGNATLLRSTGTILPIHAGGLLDEDNDSDTIWADNAYLCDAIEDTLALIGFDRQIHERGYRNHPLTEEQKLSNRSKSKTCARVEQVFGT